MSRTVARDQVFQLVFSFIFTGEKDDINFAISMENLTLTEDDKNYIQNTYQGVMEHYDEIIKIIEPRINGFTLQRLEKARLAAIIIGVYDIMYNKISPEECISPVVDLVKKYGADDDGKSSGYVNAVLRSMVRDKII